MHYHVFASCSTVADWTTWWQWMDHKKCSLSANRQQKRRDSWCGHLLQQKRWEAFWWSGWATHGGNFNYSNVTIDSFYIINFYFAVFYSTEYIVVVHHIGLIKSLWCSPSWFSLIKTEVSFGFVCDHPLLMYSKQYIIYWCWSAFVP